MSSTTMTTPEREAVAFDPKEFRRALGSFPTGVAIITTRDGEGAPSGLTCNSFSSVSLEPPLVLWSLRKASKSIDTFRAAQSFVINVLAEDQDELSSRFATSSIIQKFEGVAWSTGYRDMPLIDDCVARFECSVFAQHDAGDHVVFIGKVEKFEVVREEDPLVFYKGAYMMLQQSMRELASKGRISHQALADSRRMVYVALLRLACENAQPADFDAIEANLRQMDAQIMARDMPGRMKSAIRFFELISAAAHNEVMSLVARSLNTLLLHTVKAQAATRAAQDVYVPALDPIRWEILSALRARDEAAAVAAVAQYVQRATLH
ncbi:FMN reductase (NADH) NtaB [Variovorax sp. PBL-H6]|uniref:flavin reductase n=1 Tax=Variovorax sp. PBL-H6 TaxID=434009 RepID=UPI001316E611|nr:flavin reductase [Variovorax sp. PBL-H6]VTU26172.1 FMN reductase (NADH) NtaB [Variovorax sp. PBL-H6]